MSDFKMSVNDSNNLNVDYKEIYNDYWSRADREGESSGDLEFVADQILKICGVKHTLDIGSGEGGLVSALLRRGVDSYGLDVSEIVVARANIKLANRFTHGSVLSLPFQDAFFHTIVSTDCMEHLASEDVPKALKEMYRVAGRYVFLQIATTQDRDNHWHLTVEGRMWWESKCFEAGFRKHPAYYTINDYEALNKDGWQIYILLEKVPALALQDYPLSSLNEERGLHMDMTRDSGERSDAHIIRYQWACDYIKSGDRVLDGACGLGYGSHVVRHLSQASKVVGIDGSAYAIDYANKAFPCAEGRAEYRVGMLPEVLSDYPDGSFEVIISFETLEHVEHPVELLNEFYRLLTPGGRVIVSVPNDWSDETGEDPNPYHLQVYDWTKLKAELSTNFIIENAYAQTASQCKIATKDGIWERQPRLLHEVTLSEDAPEDCEWWLMTAMKSPLVNNLPYVERVFANLAVTDHPSTRYVEFFNNPWLMHAMVNVGYRLKNTAALQELANQVINASVQSSNDYAAALCVKAYQLLESENVSLVNSTDVLSQIEQVLNLPIKDKMGLRWKVSLSFVKGRLLQALGNFQKAKQAFFECSTVDVRAFGIHLATKTTEALYIAGRLAYVLGDANEARTYWRSGVEYGKILLDASLEDVLINVDYPNRFNHGDGVREHTVAWDNLAKCANGINLLNIGVDIDFSELDNCNQTEYVKVTKDVIKGRQVLIERTALLEQSNQDIHALTLDLVNTRETLIERTALLEQLSKELQEHTADLVSTRGLLVERTDMLEKINSLKNDN